MDKSVGKSSPSNETKGENKDEKDEKDEKDDKDNKDNKDKDKDSFLNPTTSILRISILDKICGCPLYDKVYKWKEDQKSPSSIAGLVQFFYQFAREIDNGVVSKVTFESQSLVNSSSGNIGHSSSSSSGGNISSINRFNTLNNNNNNKKTSHGSKTLKKKILPCLEHKNCLSITVTRQRCFVPRPMLLSLLSLFKGLLLTLKS